MCIRRWMSKMLCHSQGNVQMLWWLLRWKYPEHSKKRAEQHFQDVAQKFGNNKNSDSFAAHFAKHFTQKPSPQQCRKIMSFDILSTVNPIGSMETWDKLSCTLCMKERIEIIDNSWRRYSRIINACSEVYGSWRHIPIFHRFTQHWWSSDGWKSREFRIFQIRLKKTVSGWSRKFWERRRSQPLGGYF